MNWIRVTHADNIPLREGRSVKLGTLDVAIMNLGERYVAVENRCPHRGGPLADGIVGGAAVTCPLHNWRICLDTGQVVKPAGQTEVCVRTFPVKVEDGIIWLQVANEHVILGPPSTLAGVAPGR